MWFSLLVMGDVHMSACIISNGKCVTETESSKGNRQCFPNEHALQENKLFLMLDNERQEFKCCKVEAAGCPRRVCQMLGDTVRRTVGGCSGMEDGVSG